MSPELLQFLAKELPTVVAIIFIVVYMVRSARARDKEWHENMKALVAYTHERYKENMAACERRNAETCAAIGSFKLTVDELNRNLHKLNGG